MRKSRPWSVFGQWLLGALLGWGSCSVEASTNTANLVSSNTAFAFSLYSQLGANGGNLFFSPYSISSCLGMTYAGARGETASQMAEALDFGTNQAQFGSNFGALQSELDRLQTSTNVQFTLANGLWTQEGFPFLPAFLNSAVSNFQAVVNQANFVAQAETVRGEINQWVAQKTQGIIVNLLGPGTVTGDTRAVLVNAIYFKGAWATAFDTNATSVQPFHVSPSQTVNVPLMSQTETLNYYQGETFQAVELPYRGNNVTMVVFLPTNPDGLSQLEVSLIPQQLNQVAANSFGQQVELYLPRFSLETTANLIPDLQSLGMNNAFVRYVADFSGMDGTNDLYISVVAHKAFVDVDETGTVAAAATGVVVGIAAIPEPIPVVFRADHPFLFLIREVSSGSILFMGRVVAPPAASAPAVTQNSAAFPSASYRGLFYDTNGVALQSSGAINFSVSTNGKFSGAILLVGKTSSFSGQLYAGADSATVTIPRAHLSDLVVTLDCSTNGGISGGVLSDGTWTAEIQCVPTSDGYSTAHPAPQAGNYTMTLLTESDGMMSPGYGSFGQVTVMPNGGLNLAGLLSDGTVVSQASAISTNGYWPLYIPLYAGKGELLGWINFTNQRASRFNGTVSWIKTSAYGSYYTNGFTNSVTALGSIIHR